MEGKGKLEQGEGSSPPYKRTARIRQLPRADEWIKRFSTRNLLKGSSSSEDTYTPDSPREPSYAKSWREETLASRSQDEEDPIDEREWPADPSSPPPLVFPRVPPGFEDRKKVLVEGASSETKGSGRKLKTIPTPSQIIPVLDSDEERADEEDPLTPDPDDYEAYQNDPIEQDAEEELPVNPPLEGNPPEEVPQPMEGVLQEPALADEEMEEPVWNEEEGDWEIALAPHGDGDSDDEEEDEVMEVGEEVNEEAGSLSPASTITTVESDSY